MNIKELKEMIKDIDDDFEITPIIAVALSEDTLKKRSYPYPYDYYAADFTIGDISYSDKFIHFMYTIKESHLF